MHTILRSPGMWPNNRIRALQRNQTPNPPQRQLLLKNSTTAHRAYV